MGLGQSALVGNPDVRVGDILVSVDGIAIKGYNEETTMHLIRGDPDSKIVLVLADDGNRAEAAKGEKHFFLPKFDGVRLDNMKFCAGYCRRLGDAAEVVNYRGNGASLCKEHRMVWGWTSARSRMRNTSLSQQLILRCCNALERRRSLFWLLV